MLIKIFSLLNKFCMKFNNEGVIEIVEGKKMRYIYNFKCYWMIFVDNVSEYLK